MGAALAVTAVGYRLVWRTSGPLVGQAFQLPPGRRPDARPLVGSTLFGIGWGLLGLCPGPAVAALASGEPIVLLFLAAMGLGMATYRSWIVFEARLVRDAERG